MAVGGGHEVLPGGGGARRLWTIARCQRHATKTTEWQPNGPWKVPRHKRTSGPHLRCTSGPKGVLPHGIGPKTPTHSKSHMPSIVSLSTAPERIPSRPTTHWTGTCRGRTEAHGLAGDTDGPRGRTHAVAVATHGGIEKEGD